MALISFRRSARDHLQLCQLRELGENFVPHSTGKVRVGLLFAQVFKRKHSDRFFGQVARPDDVDLGFRRAVRCAHDSVSVRSKNQESTSATGNPSTMKSTIRRTTEFGISNTGKTCEIPSASAQPPTAYATATVKTLRLFSSSKNSLGSMAVCPKLSPFQRSFTSSTVNDQVAHDLPHRLGKLRPIQQFNPCFSVQIYG